LLGLQKKVVVSQICRFNDFSRWLGWLVDGFDVFMLILFGFVSNNALGHYQLRAVGLKPDTKLVSQFLAALPLPD